MNLDQLKKGQQLTEIINRTENGLIKLKEIQSNRKREDRRDNDFDDGQYNLVIGEYAEKSSVANLTRYNGNTELLDVIINKLEEQLAQFKLDFKSL